MVDAVGVREFLELTLQKVLLHFESNDILKIESFILFICNKFTKTIE